MPDFAQTSDGKLEILDVRILIPTPTGSRVGEFANSLCAMLAYLQWNAPKAKDGRLIRALPVFLGGSVLPHSRRELVSYAQKVKAEYVLWLDDDMEFPADTLNHLLSHEKLIVGANYPTKKIAARPTAQIDRRTPCYTRLDSTGLEKIFSMGFGVLLMKMSVFENLPQPWFEMTVNPDTDGYIGEDVSFFRQLAKHKPEVEAFVDHDLSKKVAHWGTLAFTHALVKAPPKEAKSSLFLPNGARV